MQFVAHFLRHTKLPGGTSLPGSVSQRISNPLHIDNGMSRKNLRQPIGEIACQTLAGPLCQPKFKIQGITMLTRVSKRNVIAPFFRVAKKRFEKLVSTTGRKNSLELVIGKNVAILVHPALPLVKNKKLPSQESILYKTFGRTTRHIHTCPYIDLNRD